MTCTAPPNWWGGYGFAASIARRYVCKVGGGAEGKRQKQLSPNPVLLAHCCFCDITIGKKKKFRPFSITSIM